jgi:hypothetical protein
LEKGLIWAGPTLSRSAQEVSSDAVNISLSIC